MELTLTVKGSPDALRRVLAALGDAGTPDTDYTMDKARALVRRITATARKPLRYQLENAPEASIDAFLEQTGLDPNHVGGTNTSVSAQVKALGLPRLVEADYNRRVWRVDPEAAPVVLRALDELERETEEDA